jgi:hypothetical protein
LSRDKAEIYQNMLKIVRYFALILFAFLWFLGCSPDTARWLGKQGLVEDDYRYGDLYRFSNLKKFRVPVEKCEAIKSLSKVPVNLFLFGDSFTEEGRIEVNHFAAKNFIRNFVAVDGYVRLSPKENNVLIIETVERHFRERFDLVYTHVKVNQTEPLVQEKTLWQHILAWELPYKTESHESILFGSDFFFTFKEWKAAINQHIFHRTDENVRLSKDGKHIVYGLAANPGPNSSFCRVTNNEIDRLVENINGTYAKYKSEGFIEVYLNIIPNKTSILAIDLGEYNHLIERIQQHPNLKMPFIDSYGSLNSGGEKLFDKGDTHWNCEGKQLWINEVNKRLTVIGNSAE